MRLLLMMIILALSIPAVFVESSAAEETVAKPQFMGIFKGSYRDSYPQAIVVKRFLIANGAYSKKKRTTGDEVIVQKMSEKVLNEFISKGSANCKSQYFVIEEVSTQVGYHPKGPLLLLLDANVVCFNTSESPKI